MADLSWAAALSAATGGGGGTGVSDYNQLQNRPVVNVTGSDIVISVLSTGVYNIDGTWKMTPDDQERATGKDDLFYVFNDESGTRLTWVSAGKIVIYNVPQGGTADDIVESEVATIDEVADQLVGDF